jgi:arginine decarboxylase
MTKKKSVKHVWKLGDREVGTDVFDANKDGELIIREGHYQYNVHDLVRKFGSSIEIFLPFVIEERLNKLYELFHGHIKHAGYKGKFFYHYPMKVNQNKEAVLPLVSEGAHLEVGSVNELTLVRKLWEGAAVHHNIRVLCNGPKTRSYVELIHHMAEKQLRIVPIIEDLQELDLFKEFRGDMGIRINLQTKVKSHWDKKADRFGLLEEELLELGKIRNFKILHYHIGSQIERGDDIIRPLKEAFGVYRKLRAIHPALDTIDMGGGFGIPYAKKKLYSADVISRRVVATLKTLAEDAEIPHPNIIVEWGRYIMAPAQITVFKIVSSKEVPKGLAKFWYIIDGSFMNDLLDTWALHQKWHVVPVNHLDAKKKNRVWLAGLSCDSDDKYTAKDGYLTLPRLDDLDHGEDLYVAIFDTGAYQDAFASHHCLLSSPLKIVLQNGIVTVARKRETAEDIGKLFGW